MINEGCAIRAGLEGIELESSLYSLDGASWHEFTSSSFERTMHVPVRCILLSS